MSVCACITCRMQTSMHALVHVSDNIDACFYVSRMHTCTCRVYACMTLSLNFDLCIAAAPIEIPSYAEEKNKRTTEPASDSSPADQLPVQQPSSSPIVQEADDAQQQEKNQLPS